MAKDKNGSNGEDNFRLEPSIEEVNSIDNDASLVSLTMDLQRLQAEFQNYRRRAEKEKLEAKDLVTAKVLGQLLPVLDDLDRAREHGELESQGFRAVAYNLETVTRNLGLEKFMETQVPFDPNIHEAIVHERSSSVNETLVNKILRPGYRFKGVIIRPAQVVTLEPLN